MGERLLCKQEVIGSIPFTSTIRKGGVLSVIATGLRVFSMTCGLFDIVKNSFREHTSVQQITFKTAERTWVTEFSRIQVRRVYPCA